MLVIQKSYVFLATIYYYFFNNLHIKNVTAQNGKRRFIFFRQDQQEPRLRDTCLFCHLWWSSRYTFRTKDKIPLVCASSVMNDKHLTRLRVDSHPLSGWASVVAFTQSLPFFSSTISALNSMAYPFFFWKHYSIALNNLHIYHMSTCSLKQRHNSINGDCVTLVWVTGHSTLPSIC